MFDRITDFVEQSRHSLSNVIVGGMAVWYVYRVLTFRPQEAR